MVIGSAETLDPLGRRPVLVGARRARDLAIGDVADQEVAECVLALTLDRRTPCALDELLALEPEQGLLRRGPLDPADCPLAGNNTATTPFPSII